MPGGIVAVPRGKLTPQKTSAVLRAFARAGWHPIPGRPGGRHTVLQKAGRILTVPRHRTIRRGLLRALIRQAGLTVEEFLDLL
jgi:predicted RNA binding protein YcfA (HicA-like mRNA interferase family)